LEKSIKMRDWIHGTSSISSPFAVICVKKIRYTQIFRYRILQVYANIIHDLYFRWDGTGDRKVSMQDVAIYARRSSMCIHLRLCSKESKFSCILCGKKFKYEHKPQSHLTSKWWQCCWQQQRQGNIEKESENFYCTVNRSICIRRR